jgi:hypothetical protein
MHIMEIKQTRELGFVFFLFLLFFSSYFLFSLCVCVCVLLISKKIPLNSYSVTVTV